MAIFKCKICGGALELDGKEAVACGIIDSVGGLSDALAALREMIGEARKGEPS